jgi:glycosyltransferase involved in cell wall biosynthesis
VRLAIYCDSGVNGGHEAMLKRLVLALAECPELDVLHVLVPVANEALFAYVKSVAVRHPRVDVIALPFTAESIRRDAFGLLKMTSRVAAMLRTLRVSKLVIAQGTIASALAGVFAARLTRTTAVSYLPLVDDPAQAPPGWAGPLKWWVKRALYRLPHEFITLNDYLRGRLSELAPNARVSILENCVDDRFDRAALTRDDARRLLGLPETGKRIFAHIGRIQFQQKRQDFLMACIERHAERFRDAIVLIVGDGPDAGALERIVRRSATLAGCVRIVGPQADVLPYIVASDALVLPSAYEGVPLVMIEAILAGRPIVASRVCGLDAYLPDALLFRPDDQDECVEKLFTSGTLPLAALTGHFRQRFSRDAFDGHVRRLLLSSCASHGGAADDAQGNRADFAAKAK